VPRSDADPNKMGHYRRAQLDSIDLLRFRQTQVHERFSDALSSVCASLCLGLSLCMCVCMCVRDVSYRLFCSDVGNVTGHVLSRWFNLHVLLRHSLPRRVGGILMMTLKRSLWTQRGTNTWMPT
jgi:hypothetical protein